ncbi:uncharacterized protein EI97DRAFT_436957 [Westerdykella ornata]|uniref:Uncharacterized protein n=1 Tax=Westerdykella ornata TaxID=318751 RepID=A0A6A6JA14_WESOR|nr:uncharacterized protein EI97DRAFT_436957 [Westerdykella ornata]KAF2272466.1 hypothetical protein EI97DRAFT_436957 [Westerdykella ornata]
MPGRSLPLRLHISNPQCRYKTTAAVLRGDALGPTQQSAHRTHRILKTGETLPLPPLLDPLVLEQRSKWTQPKKPPDAKTFTPFQKKLYATPYAHMLASPVRQCRLTHILLPSDLLLSLHARNHPGTTDPWILPVSATTTTKKKEKQQLGAPFRFINRQVVLEELGRRRKWAHSMGPRFEEAVGKTRLSKIVWREDMVDFVLGLMRKRVLGALRWGFGRVGQYVPVASPRTVDLEGMMTQKGNGNGNGNGKGVDVSCVLVLGTLKTHAEDLQARCKRISDTLKELATSTAEILRPYLDPHRQKGVTHHPPWWYRGPLVPTLQPRLWIPPLEFKTTVCGGKKVPVYSLCDLLGEENLNELLADSKFKDDKCLVIPRGRHNVPVETLLMELQAFLASPGP